MYSVARALCQPKLEKGAGSGLSPFPIPEALKGRPNECPFCCRGGESERGLVVNDGGKPRALVRCGAS